MLRRLAPQILKFSITGSAAAIVHFTTLSLLIELAHLPWPTLASAIGAAFGITTSYLGNYAWTFARRESHYNFAPRFVGVYLLSMTLNTSIFYVQVNYLGLDYRIAFLLATGVSTITNFILCKVAVFERRLKLAD